MQTDIVTKIKETITGTSAKDAVSVLESQHREVEALFAQFDAAGERAYKKKEGLAATICDKLTMHTKIEESIFYPAAKEADEDMVLESFEEHDNVKAMIRKIQRTEASDESFDAKVTVLKELVEHHVKEEENDLFPKCREALGEEKLVELGEKMQARMQRLEKMH